MPLTTKEQAIKIFEAAVAAVHPNKLLRKHLYADDKELRIGDSKWQRNEIGKLVVIAAGKAAAAMALAAEEISSDSITEALCITKHGHALPLQKFRTIEAGHPIPDENSVNAADEIQHLLKDLHASDIVLVLLSGGASSLIADIPAGCSLIDIQELNKKLINSGASIQEINTVRKHISTLKGGQLTKAVQPANVITLGLSDVVGDDPSVIASGLTVADTSTFKDAVTILEQYNLWNDLPASVKTHFEKGLKGTIAETPKPDDDCFLNSNYNVIGNNAMALKAAQFTAEMLGYNSFIFKENLTDNVETLARQLIQQFQDYKGKTPACILLGGEPVLKVKNDGKGGRAQHFVLTALDELSKSNSESQLTIMAAGTDGTDGPTDAAGAIGDRETVYRTTTAADIQLSKYLERFDAYNFFEKMDGLFKTEPTQTNVSDIIILLVE